MRYQYFAFVIAALATHPASAQISKRLPEEVRQCENRDGKTDAEASINACTKVIEDPSATQQERYAGYILRANPLFRSEDYRGALESVNRAIEIAPSASAKAEAFFSRAKIHEKMGKAELAWADVDSSIAAGPSFPDPLIVRGRRLDSQDKFREALADYDKANSIRKTSEGLNASCWVRAAKLNAELERALEDCDAALRLSQSSEILDSRGMVGLRAGRLEDAFDDYDQAVRSDPKSASALFGRGLAAIGLGRKTEGEADIAKAAQLDPKVAATYASRGLVPGQVKRDMSLVSGPRVSYDWGDQRLAERVEDCSYFKYADADSFALAHKQGQTLAQVDADYVKRNAENAKTQAFCLRRLKYDYPSKSAMLEQAARTSLRDLNASVREARAQFLSNPAKYMSAGSYKDYTVERLKADLNNYKQFKTLQQTCGTFDYSMPNYNNRDLDRRHAQRRQYAQCAINYRDTLHDKYSSLLDIHFKIVREELDSFVIYTCSRYKQLGCIPDDRWRSLDRVVSPENIAFVKRIDSLLSSEYTLANNAVRDTNKWVDDVNANVDAYNRANN